MMGDVPTAGLSDLLVAVNRDDRMGWEGGVILKVKVPSSKGQIAQYFNKFTTISVILNLPLPTSEALYKNMLTALWSSDFDVLTHFISGGKYCGQAVPLLFLYSHLLPCFFVHVHIIYPTAISSPPPAKYGSWGLREYQDQSASDNPKVKAMETFIADHNKVRRGIFTSLRWAFGIMTVGRPSPFQQIWLNK